MCTTFSVPGCGATLLRRREVVGLFGRRVDPGLVQRQLPLLDLLQLRGEGSVHPGQVGRLLAQVVRPSNHLADILQSLRIELSANQVLRHL